MADPEPTPTPAPELETFSKDYVSTLRSEAAGHRTNLRKAEADLSAAVAERDALKTQLTEAQAASGSSDGRVSAAEARVLALEVALDKALPASLARRLSGSTREELEADADELLKLTGRAPAPTPGQGTPPPPTPGLSPIQAALAAARGTA